MLSMFKIMNEEVDVEDDGLVSKGIKGVKKLFTKEPEAVPETKKGNAFTRAIGRVKKSYAETQEKADEGNKKAQKALEKNAGYFGKEWKKTKDFFKPEPEPTPEPKSESV